ncbi:MAG TPA: phosphatase PAP2 family protein [Gemmatimonadaceae bacterium]|nr:phosphatase PAP2 family protein [Gemmatimonadaceae bacterium]
MHASHRAAGARIAALLLALAPALAPAQQAQTDTTGVKPSQEPLFTSRDAIYAGAFTLATVALLPLDRKIAEELQDKQNQSNRFFRHQATNFRLIAQPGAFAIGGALYLGGRLAHNERMADLGLHGSEAILVGLVTTGAIKGMAGRARPYMGLDTPHDFKLFRGFTGGSDYSSFPSGHTLVGFAAAAAVTAETHRWWPHSTWYIAPVMYGGATMIGLSRMYNNKHWASDVMMGAAIGTFAGRKVVQYHHSHPKNRIDRWLLGATIASKPGGGLSFAFSAIPRFDKQAGAVP